MKATTQRECPRCTAPIEPGQEMVPMPRGWTHLTCVRCCARHDKAASA